MSILVRGMTMPKDCWHCELSVLHVDRLWCRRIKEEVVRARIDPRCPLVEVPTPHGDLIDRDALIKDGWLNLHKEVIRMGGYAIYELTLKNPSIPVIIPAEEGENGT